MQKPTESTSSDNHRYRGPLIILTILFFLWGLLTALNDVLIPHLKAIYSLSYVEAMLVKFCFFGAYFIVSVPAAVLIKKVGYQHSMIVGLIVAAIGCALFFPAALTNSGVFLLAFFVLAAGIAVLQVAANPYVAMLGKPEVAASRLTLAQAFNSLGTMVAPVIGSALIFSIPILSRAEFLSLPESEQWVFRTQEMVMVQGPYLVLALVLLTMAVLIHFAKLPQIHHAPSNEPAAREALALEYRHLIFGAMAIFVYVGAEVSISSFMVNFLAEPSIAGLPTEQAIRYLTFYWGGAMIGRFVGAAVLLYVSPGKVLAVNASCAIILILAAIFGQGEAAMWALIAVGLFNSIMFPTIFSTAISKLGPLTSRGSGLLCTAIVGGAIIPFMQGFLADTYGLRWSYLLPVACYGFILFFGLRYMGMYLKSNILTR